MTAEGFIMIGRADEFGDRRPREVVLEGTRIVVLKIRNEFFAFENSCPHQHFSLLHQGTVDGCTLTCPMHGWTFDVRTGVSTNGNGKLKMSAVKSEDGALWLKAGEPGQSFAMFDSEGATP